MNSRQRVRLALNHQEADHVPLDIAGTGVSQIHITAYTNLRKYLKLPEREPQIIFLAEELPHVFDRFWRAEKSRNRATGGLGLGLAIVKQLVEPHGGQVQVASQVGGGTQFRLYFPRV